MPLHRPSSMQVHHLTAHAPKAEFTSTRLELELRRATEAARGRDQPLRVFCKLLVIRIAISGMS